MYSLPSPIRIVDSIEGNANFVDLVNAKSALLYADEMSGSVIDIIVIQWYCFLEVRSA